MRGVVSAVVFSALAIGGVGAAQAQIPAASVRTAYTIEPFTPEAPVTIQGTGVRLRAEPFATPQTQVLSSGSTGLALNVVGIARQPDWNWYQVVLKNGQKAFIRSDLTSAPSRGGTSPAPVQPSSPTPIVSSTPVYRPSSPVSAQPAAPLDPPISLTPRSAPPPNDWTPPSAQSSDPSGLLSVPPGQ